MFSRTGIEAAISLVRLIREPYKTCEGGILPQHNDTLAGERRMTVQTFHEQHVEFRGFVTVRMDAVNTQMT
jgi:hypothetical protein